MRKISLCSLGCLVALMLAAQQGHVHRYGGSPQHLYPGPSGGPHSRLARPGMQGNADLLKAPGFMVLDSLTESRWNENSSIWVPDYRAYYDFNPYGWITSFRDQEWDESAGGWVDRDLEEYEYNGNGELLLYTDFTRDETGGGWYSSWKQEFGYQGKRMTGSTEYQRDHPGDEFYPVWRVEFLYDEADRVTGTREYIHAANWVETWRTEYVYDTGGRLVTFFEYDDSGSEPAGWEFAWKEEYTYDAAGHLILGEGSEWDAENDRWMNSDREEYTVSSNGDIESYLELDRDDATGAWVNSWKGEYEYDTEVPYDRLYLPWFFRDDLPRFFNHRMLEYYAYTYQGGIWRNYYRGAWHFTSTGATGADLAGKVGVRIYPNPVSGSLFLEAEGWQPYRVEIFDLTGRKVLTSGLEGEGRLDLTGLPAGIYCCTVTGTGGKVLVSEKILVSGGD